MDEHAAPGQVYVSGWPKRLVSSRLVPRPVLIAIAKVVVGVMRRRIRASDQRDAGNVPPTGDRKPAIYFADIYHGGVTFWDWIVLRGGGLWWDVLWPLVIKTSVERLQAHPDLRTVLELDAHTYEELAQRRPADLDALRAVIARGHMEIVNGTYAQPLAQTISGEANLRHFFYGLDTIERVLGARVDSFVAGEPQFFPQLPQVLTGFGIANAVFRTHWAPFGTDPAADAEVVRWQGPDGSVVRTVPRYGCMDYRLMLEGHPGLQNAGLTGDDFEQWPAARKDEFAAHAAQRGIQRPFITRLADPKPPESPFPKVFTAARNPGAHMVTVKEYFDLPRQDEPQVSYTIDDIPSTIPWGLAGEQLHREQTLAESALLLAERLDAILQTQGSPAQQDQLDAAWKLLLRSQHHDLLLCGPWHSTVHGTSMGEVGCRGARDGTDRAQRVTVTALEALAARFRYNAQGSALLLFNPSPWPRREFVELPTSADAVDVWQRDARLEAQMSLRPDEGPRVGFIVDLPPLGVDVVELRAAQSAAVQHEPAPLAADEDLIAKEIGSGLIKGGYLTVWKDGRLQRSATERIRIEAAGPIFRCYRVEGRVAEIPFVQWITVVPSLARIQLATAIDFGNGQHLGPQLADHRSDLAYYIQDEKKLCLNFESSLPQVFCDSPFLLVEPKGARITALSFVGMEESGRGGVAVLHKGTPGWYVDRGTGAMRNVLAWGPERWLYASDDSMTPGWARYTAVRGVQRYEHAIAAITTRIDALRAAHDFRLPVLAVDLQSGRGNRSAPWSFLDVAPANVILTALFARDGNTYARLWNASDEPTDATLRGTNGSAGVSFRLEEGRPGRLPPADWPSMRPWGIQTVLLQKGAQ